MPMDIYGLYMAYVVYIWFIYIYICGLYMFVYGLSIYIYVCVCDSMGYLVDIWFVYGFYIVSIWIYVVSISDPLW